jgi:uncharacterized protein YxjI
VRYLLRERILSWGDDFSITDADGREAFHVDGRVFSFGDKLSFKDRDGNEVALIDQKLLSIGPQYDIIRGGKVVAVVKKHLFTLLRARFTVDVPGPDDLEARGELPRSRIHVRARRARRSACQQEVAEPLRHLRGRCQRGGGRCPDPGIGGRDRPRVPSRSEERLTV